MLNMLITIITYFFKFFQLKPWWTYRLQSGNTEGIEGQGYLEEYDYINRHRNTGVYYVSQKEERPGL